VTTREIIEAALALPPEERAKLVDEVSASLDADAAGTVQVDDALLALVRRREDAVRKGTPTFTVDEVFDELLAE